MNTKRFAVIVAGGKGVRMGHELPKQFIEIGGLPILMHTLATFSSCQPSVEIILVLPQNQIDFWKTLCAQYNFTIPHTCAIGGTTRTESVKNGLAQISGEGLVAIHDGVRPLATHQLINNAFDIAQKKGSAIAAVPLKDSIRKLLPEEKSKALNRAEYQLVQTPQTFQVKLIKEAYLQTENSEVSFTDDASVVEAIGHEVNLVEGSYQNIKITTPEDLLFAEAYLKQNQ